MFRNSFKKIFKFDEGFLKVIEKPFDLFLVLMKTGSDGSFDKVLIHFIDGLELVVVWHLLAGVKPGLVVWCQSTRTLCSVDLFNYNVFEIEFGFGWLFGQVGCLAPRGIASWHFFVQFKLIFEFGIFFSELFIDFLEQGDLKVFGLLDGSGLFGPTQSDKGIAPWQYPLWEATDARLANLELTRVEDNLLGGLGFEDERGGFAEALLFHWDG